MDGYILLSHGSKVKESNDANQKIVEILRSAIENIELAFLELTEPDFESAVKNLKASNVKFITVLPLFLAPGKHVIEDVPQLASKFSKEYEIEIRVLEHIGAKSEYIELIKNILLSS